MGNEAWKIIRLEKEKDLELKHLQDVHSEATYVYRRKLYVPYPFTGYTQKV